MDKRRFKQKFNKFVRRSHMYAGLALVPWVIMYGVTAVMFNHSSWFTPTQVYEVESDDLDESFVNDLPPAADVAALVMEQLERAGGDGPSELRLVGHGPRWVGTFSTSANTESERLRISFDPLGRGGKISATPTGDDEEEEEVPDIFTDEELEAIALEFIPTKEQIEEQHKALAEANGLEVTKLSRGRYPSVEFDLTDGEHVYTCDVGMDGDVEIDPARGPATLRRRLLRLHVQHGDPGYNSWRRAWALIVDIMGIAMVVWGLSGIIMWWAIKKTRKAGAWSIVAGCLAMVVLAVSVWRVTGMS